jgi:hypothetical protein
MAEKWNLRRWKQLKDLEKLLYECVSINNGSGAIERIQRIGKAAGKLNGHRMSFTVKHFIRFLNEQAETELRKKRQDTISEVGESPDAE